MEEEEYFDSATMLRLAKKGKLIKDVSFIFDILAKEIEVYKRLGWRGKRFLSLAVKSVHNDFKIGLKKINKKVPVYVELPKYKPIGDDGVISKTFDGEKKSSSYEVREYTDNSTKLIDLTDEADDRK